MSDVFIKIRTEFNNSGIAQADKALGGLLNTVLRGSVALTAFGIIVKKAFDFSKEGAMLSRLEKAGDNLARSYGQNMNTIIGALDKAAHGTVARTDLILSANRAMMLGVSTSATEMANLLEVAALRGRAMGLSTTQAFNDIVTGVGRMSPLILDNLGIVVDLERRTREWAAANGVATESVDAATKRQILLAGVLEEGNRQLSETGGLLDDTATAYERFGAEGEDAFNRLKKSAGEFFEPLVLWVADSLSATNELNDAFDTLALFGVNTMSLWREMGSGAGKTREEIIALANTIEQLQLDKLTGVSSEEVWDEITSKATSAGQDAASGFLEGFDTGLTGKITGLSDKIALALAGGTESTDLFDAIVANAPTIGPEQTQALLDKLLPQDLAQNVVAGLLDPDEAAALLAGELNLTMTEAWGQLGAAEVFAGMDEQAVAQQLADKFSTTFQEAMGILKSNMGTQPSGMGMSPADFIEVSKDAAQEIATKFDIPFKEALNMIRAEFGAEGGNKLSPADFLSAEEGVATEIAGLVGNQFTSAMDILTSSMAANPPITMEDIMAGLDADAVSEPINLGLSGIDGTGAAANIDSTLGRSFGSALGSLRAIEQKLLSLDGAEATIFINGGGVGGLTKGGSKGAFGGVLAHMASGGILGANSGMVEVGEEGREGLVWDGKNWIVVPNNVWMNWKRKGLKPGAGMKAGSFEDQYHGGGGGYVPPFGGEFNISKGGALNDPYGGWFNVSKGDQSISGSTGGGSLKSVAQQTAMAAASNVAAGVGSSLNQINRQISVDQSNAFTRAQEDLMLEVIKLRKVMERNAKRTGEAVAQEIPLAVAQ